MVSRTSKVDSGVNVCFIVSAGVHLAVFMLLAWWNQLSPSHMKIQETYYVDVVTLPTVDPHSERSAQKQSEPVQKASPATTQPMTAPIRSNSAPKAVMHATQRKASPEPTETESEFAERMAKLERKAEAQQYEEEMKRLSSKKNTSSNTRTGLPAISDTEAGSRYADYIKSRLEDALKVTSSYTSKKPEVAVRLAIAADGRLLRTKIERSSGDATFELAVRRAIDLASDKFPTPPNRAIFENGFVFKPKGISNSTKR